MERTLFYQINKGEPVKFASGKAGDNIITISFPKDKGGEKDSIILFTDAEGNTFRLFEK